MHPTWVHDIRDQCETQNVAFFFKQWGAWAPATDPDALMVSVDGEIYDDASDRGADDTPVSMRRIGKAAAGRDLDGRRWDEMPTK